MYEIRRDLRRCLPGPSPNPHRLHILSAPLNTGVPTAPETSLRAGDRPVASPCFDAGLPTGPRSFASRDLRASPTGPATVGSYVVSAPSGSWHPSCRPHVDYGSEPSPSDANGIANPCSAASSFAPMTVWAYTGPRSGISWPMFPDLAAPTARAAVFGRHSRASTASRILRFVGSETRCRGLSRNRRDTMLTSTRAKRATSFVAPTQHLRISAASRDILATV